MLARVFRLRLALALSALALYFALFLPSVAGAEPKRHHLTLGFGYQNFVGDDFDDSGFQDSGLGVFAYRYSVSPTVDVLLDSRGTVSSQDQLYDFLGVIYGAEVDYTTEWFGPGVRFYFTEENTRPYVQANVYFTNERLKVDLGDTEISESEGDVGFGLQTGMDIRLSKLLSLPVEMNFLTSSPENDLTSVGFDVGLTFNFGAMP